MSAETATTMENTRATNEASKDRKPAVEGESGVVPQHRAAFSREKAPKYRTRGEWVFGKAVHGGVNFVFNSLISIGFTYLVAEVFKDRYMAAREGIGSFLIGASNKAKNLLGIQKPDIEITPETARAQGQFSTNMLLLGIPGWVLIPVIKLLDNNKAKVTRFFDSVLDKFSKPSDEELAGREAAYAAMEAEPKKNWKDMLKGRIIGWIGVNVIGSAIVNQLNTDVIKLGQGRIETKNGRAPTISDVTTHLSEGLYARVRNFIPTRVSDALRWDRITQFTLEEIWGCGITSIGTWLALEKFGKKSGKAASAGESLPAGHAGTAAVTGQDAEDHKERVISAAPVPRHAGRFEPVASYTAARRSSREQAPAAALGG